MKKIGFEIPVGEMHRFTELMKLVVSEGYGVRLAVKKGMLYFKEVDVAHVCMVELTLPGLKKTRADVDFAMNISALTSFLKVMNKKDILSIDSIDDKFLHIQCDDIHKKIGLYNLEDFEIRKTPQLNLKTKFTIDVQKLYKAIKALETITDHFEIKADANKVILTGESNWNDENIIQREFTQKEKEVVIAKADDIETSNYSIEYFLKFIDTLKKQKIEEVTISFATDNVLEATFETTCVDDKKLTGKYWLAPRIEGR